MLASGVPLDRESAAIREPPTLAPFTISEVAMNYRCPFIVKITCMFALFSIVCVAYAGLGVNTPATTPIPSISQGETLPVEGSLDPRTQATVHLMARCPQTKGAGHEWEDDFAVNDMTKTYSGDFGNPATIWQFVDTYTLSVTVTGDTAQRSFYVTKADEFSFT